MNQPRLKLISVTFCPYVQRSRIVLLEKKIAHTIEYINLQQPPAWFHDISPLDKVPVLLVDDAPLFESMPISEYLDEITPGSLYPDDPFTRAQHRAWIEFGNDILSQHHALISARDETAWAGAQTQFAQRLHTLEAQLGAGPYFAGARFGMVDAVYAPIFRFASHLQQLFGLELIPADTPKVRKWAADLLARPAVKSAVPASFREDYLGLITRLQGLLAQQLAEQRRLAAVD